MLIGRIGRKSRIRQDRVKQVILQVYKKKQTLQRNVCFLMYIKDD